MVPDRRTFLAVTPRALAAAAGALLAGCRPVEALNATVDIDGLTVVRDVPYAPGPRHVMDVYRPEGVTAPLPVVVFLYGGAWRTGSKADYVFVAAALARAGMVVVVPDYRLYPQVVFPEFLEDCARAVAAARVAAVSWGGDPARLFLVGHSAGAYNAVMLALDPRWLAAAGNDRSRLAGVVGIAGPYDFPREAADDPVFGGAPAAQTQPVAHVDGRNPPLLLLQGEDDGTVHAYNTRHLAARITAAGGQVETRFYPGVGHIGIVLGFSRLFRGRSPVLADVTEFVRKT